MPLRDARGGILWGDIMLRGLILIIALALAPASASANSFERSIVSQLRAQGYTNIEIGRTLLGRGRITAQSRDLNREIIFNPATGAILRDFARRRDGVELFDPGEASTDPARDGVGGGIGSPDGDSDGDGDGDSDGGDGDGDGGDGDGGDGDGDGDGGGDD